MSHASLLVALSKEDLERAGGNVEEAVKYQMEPFDESGHWFKEGSRWDWWQIGGRFTGKLAPDYDPSKDPANVETCWLCGGTGNRDDDLGRDVRKHDPNYTCNGCEGKGRSVKWPTEWAKFSGDVRLRGELDGVAGKITAFAFLRDRSWHECGRLGWFGGTISTECEMVAVKDGKEFVGRCIHRKKGAKVVSWTGPKDGEEQWGAMYFRRFIQDLPPDTTLVVVDYHV